MAAGLRPAGAARRRAPDDAHLRQHAAHGGAGHPRSSPSGSRAGQVMAHHGSLAKEQRLDCRAAAEERRAQGAGRHRLARAGHRHRRRRPRLPDRLAALDRQLPAAGRPLRPFGRRRPQGPPLPADRATSWSSAPRCSTACAAASSTASSSPSARSTSSRSRSSRRCAARRMGRGRAVRARPARLAIPRADPRRPSTRSSTCWPRGSRTAARPPRCAHPSRRGQRQAARPPRRAADRADGRRRHSRQRRLSGGARARETSSSAR